MAQYDIIPAGGFSAPLGVPMDVLVLVLAAGAVASGAGVPGAVVVSAFTRALGADLASTFAGAPDASVGAAPKENVAGVLLTVKAAEDKSATDVANAGDSGNGLLQGMGGLQEQAFTQYMSCGLCSAQDFRLPLCFSFGLGCRSLFTPPTKPCGSSPLQDLP